MKNTLLFILIISYQFSTAQKEKNTFENLFNGKTLLGWKRVAGNALYKIEQGAIVGTTVANSGNTFLITEKEYDNFVLELDIKVSDTATNSGIQIRSHFDENGKEKKGLVFGYQMEIDPSARKWSGGIYDEGRRGWLYPLSLHQNVQNTFRIGQYNHLKIECIDNEIKTWINNTPIAYVIDTVDKKGFIALQVHSINNAEQANKKIYFKNIKICTKDIKKTFFPPGLYVVNNIPNYLNEYEANNGWHLLFNGKTSEGWKGAYKETFPESGWQINNGILSVLASQGKESVNGGDIVSEEAFSFFDLSFDFKLTKGANSGIKYFVTLTEKNQGSAIGLEYQILDDEIHPDAKLGRDGNRTLASLYDLITAKKQTRFVHKIGEWNTGRIIVYPNNHVEHYLNGIKVLEYERGTENFRSLVAVSKYNVWNKFGEASKGHILLQDHGNEVSFRSIKIKELK